MSPRCSVIVPTLDADEHLGDCLSALDELDELDEPEGGYEVIVADAGSTDRTLDIATEHGVRVLDTDGAGIAASRNRAVEAAGGDALVFVDADCLPPEDLLTRAVRALEDHACVGAFYRPAPEHGWVARTWLIVEAKPPGPVRWVPAGTLAVDRQAFEAVGGFDEEMAVGEDVDLCRRLREGGFDVVHDPEMASVHLGQTDTLGGFFSNEMWRARSEIASLRRHGLVGERLPSLAMTTWTFFAVLALVATLFTLDPAWIGSAAALLALPSTAWSLREAARSGRWDALAGMLVLTLVYNLARAASIVRYNQFRDLL